MIMPNFFIVGAPKAGTTSLYYYLSQHPEVFVPYFKEPHHFASDLWHQKVGRIYRKMASRASYLSLFQKGAGCRAIGEASVFYLYSKVAASRIYRFNPSARILVCVRNPVDYLRSLHSETLLTGDEIFQDLEQALEATPAERMEHSPHPSNRFLGGFDYKRSALFGEQLERYIEWFGKDQVKTIVFDDLKSQTARIFSEVCRFLDIDPEVEVDLARVNPARKVRFQQPLRLARRQSAVKRLAARALPLSLQIRVSKLLLKMATRVEEPVPVDPRLRKRILAECEPDIRKLEGLLDRRLPSWRVTTV